MSEGIAELTEEEKKVYRVQGFSCANCAGKFERKVKKLPEDKDAKVKCDAGKTPVYGCATGEEQEEAGAYENLKVEPEKSMGQTQAVVNKEKKVYRVQGFSCANCAG